MDLRDHRSAFTDTSREPIDEAWMLVSLTPNSRKFGGYGIQQPPYCRHHPTAGWIDSVHDALDGHQVRQDMGEASIFQVRVNKFARNLNNPDSVQSSDPQSCNIVSCQARLMLGRYRIAFPIVKGPFKSLTEVSKRHGGKSADFLQSGSSSMEG